MFLKLLPKVVVLNSDFIIFFKIKPLFWTTTLSLIKIVCSKGHFIFPNCRLKGAFILFFWLFFFLKSNLLFFFFPLTYFLIFKIFLGIEKVNILAIFYNLHKIF